MTNEQTDPRTLREVLADAHELVGTTAGQEAATLDEIADFQREARAELWVLRIPPRFTHAVAADLPDNIEAAIVAWYSDGALANLVLLGPVGVGKTHAAVAAARMCHFGQGRSVTFVPVVELLDAMRPDGDSELVARALRADTLILDDLAAERGTEWTAERLYALVNRRWLDERPTIVTTNVAPDQLQLALGERLHSRLVHDAVAVRMTGDDRRRA